MEEVPLIKALDTKYSNDAIIVGISIDATLERADRTIKEKGMTWPQLADGRGFDGPIPTAYHVNGTPTIFVLDRDGRIFAKPNSGKQIEENLLKALQAAR
jgi:peroxiredoxin